MGQQYTGCGGLWMWEEREQVWQVWGEEVMQWVDHSDIARMRLLYWHNFPWQGKEEGKEEGKQQAFKGCDFWG